MQDRVVTCLEQFQEQEAMLTDLCDNVLVTGGTTALPNLALRLQSEINSCIARTESEVPSVTVSSSKFGGSLDAWVGAAALANLTVFPELCISRAEFDEFGSDIAHRKCL